MDEEARAETIGQRLRRLRLERGYSQRELSGPGVSYAYISRIEAGARRPSVKALRVLARKLGVSAEYLETGSHIHDFERRELRLAEAELRLRLESEVEQAVEELEEILADAVSAGDLAAVTRARIGLGLAAAERGDNRRAATLLEQAVDDGLVTPTSRPDVFATLGHAWSALGQPERAVAIFERCLTDLAGEEPYDDTAAMRFASYLSSALTDLGDYERAQEVLRTAVEQSDRLGDPYARVRLYWSLGRVAGNAGRPQASLNYFRRAVALLEATEDTLHLARAHLSCGWMLVSMGRLDEAGRQLERAEALLGPSPAASDLVILRRHQAELALRAGALDAAVARAEDAIRHRGRVLPRRARQRLVRRRRGAGARTARLVTPRSPSQRPRACSTSTARPASAPSATARGAACSAPPAGRPRRWTCSSALPTSPSRCAGPELRPSVDRRGRCGRVGRIRSRSRCGSRPTRRAASARAPSPPSCPRGGPRRGSGPTGSSASAPRTRPRSSGCASASRSTTTTPASSSASATTRSLGESTRRLRGLRPVRVPTVAQALLRAVAGQLITARQAREIERSVVRRATPAVDGLHVPPTAADLARFSPAELRRLGLGIRRGSALVRLCRTLDLEKLRDAPTASVAARLEREPGLGPWTVGVVALQGLGRYDRGLARDLGLVKLLAALRGRRVEAEETDALLEPYGEWAGIASVYLLAGFARGLVPLAA